MPEARHSPTPEHALGQDGLAHCAVGVTVVMELAEATSANFCGPRTTSRASTCTV